MSTDNRCMYTFSDGQLVYVVCTIQERKQYTTTRRTNEPIDATRNGDNEYTKEWDKTNTGQTHTTKSKFLNAIGHVHNHRKMSDVN